MSTTNLAIPTIADGQTDKATTLNDALNYIDGLMTDSYEVDFTSGDVTLTAALFRENLIFTCSNLGAPQDFNLPATERGMFVVDNRTGGDTVTVVKGSIEIPIKNGFGAIMWVGAGANDLFEIRTLVNYLAPFQPFLHVSEEQTSGTAGGGFTSGSWQTRDLNNQRTNEISGASLGSSQVTLPAGEYYLEGYASAYQSGLHKVKVYDTTGTTDLLIGSSEFSADGGSGDHGPSSSVVSGRFTLAVESVLELQHQCTTTNGTNGLGAASSMSVAEVYAELRVWQLNTAQVTEDTTTSYTPVLADADGYKVMNNVSATSVTIPANADVAYPVGTTINFEQRGAGQVTIGPDTGVTMNYAASWNPKTAEQYAVVTIIKTAEDVWTLFGNLEVA